MARRYEPGLTGTPRKEKVKKRKKGNKVTPEGKQMES